MERRAGPIGRLVRLALAIVAALALLSIVGPRGSAQFRNPHILTEASAWFLHALMLTVFVILVGALAAALFGDRQRRRWQFGAIVALIAALAFAAAYGQLTRGAVWGFPLADLVWWFDVVLLVEQLFAFVLAVALGTPGCEIGVWPELITRAGGTSSVPDQGLACVICLHLLDQWEAAHKR